MALGVAIILLGQHDGSPPQLRFIYGSGSLPRSLPVAVAMWVSHWATTSHAVGGQQNRTRETVCRPSCVLACLHMPLVQTNLELQCTDLKTQAAE